MKSTKKFFYIFFVLIGTLFLSQELKASEINIVSVYSLGSNFSRKWILQEINGDFITGYANKIDIALIRCSAGDCGDNLYLYRGNYDPACDFVNETCGELMTQVLNKSVTVTGTTTFDLPQTTYFDISQDYFLLLESTREGTSSSNINWVKHNANVISGNMYGSNDYTDDYNTSADMNFRIYYDTNYDTSYGGDTINYDITLSTEKPDFNTILFQNCWLDETCRLWFSYNSYDLGSTMYLTYYASSTVPYNAIASTTVTETINNQNFVIVPPPSAATTTKYNLLLDVSSYGWIVKTGISIRWLASTTLISDFSELLNCATICDDVATTSFEWWDATTYAGTFRYGLECGARKLSCWFFLPDPAAQQYFYDGVAKFENTFPINTAFSIINKVRDAVASTSDSGNNTFDMVFISSTTDEYITIPIVSSSTMAAAIGPNNAAILRRDIGYFLYIVLALAIVAVVIAPYIL